MQIYVIWNIRLICYAVKVALPIYTFGDDGSIKVIAINAAGDLSYKMNYAKAITYEIINTAAAF